MPRYIPKVGDKEHYTFSPNRSHEVTVTEITQFVSPKTHKLTVSRYYDDLLVPLALEIQYRQSINSDNVIAITGDPGTGKSTLAIQLAKAIDPGFTPDDIVYTYDDLYSKLATVEPGSTIMVDEASETMFSRKAMSSLQVRLMQAFTIFRVKRLNILLLIPSMKILDSYLRESRVQFRLHTFTRSQGREKGFYTLRRATEQLEFSKKERFFQEIGKARFKKLEAIPELREFAKEYEKKKLEYVDSKLSQSVGSQTSALHNVIYVAFTQLKADRLDAYGILTLETGMKRQSIANIVSEQRKLRGEQVKFGGNKDEEGAEV